MRQVDTVGFLGLAARGDEQAVRVDQADRLKTAQAGDLQSLGAGERRARKGDQGAIVGERRASRPGKGARAAVMWQEADGVAAIAENGDVGVGPHGRDCQGKVGRQQGGREFRGRLYHFAPQVEVARDEIGGFNEVAGQHGGAL